MAAVGGRHPTRCGTTLVVGASGYIGSHLVPRLVQQGHRVRASSRHREVLEARRWEDVELAEADVLEPAALRPTLEGVDTAYYLVHSMSSGRAFARRDRSAADNFRWAAEQAGVRRIIYLGGLQPPRHASEHLASRRETGERLRAGPIPVTEIRAGIVVGPGSAAFEIIRDLVYHVPLMVTPRWVRSLIQPIALDDLLEYLARVADAEETTGKTYDVGGPEVLTYGEMLRQFADVAGRRVFILPLPLPLRMPLLHSHWLDLVTSVPAGVARQLIEGLHDDLVADDGAIRAVVPVGLHTYRQAVEAALRLEAQESVPARWTEGALAFRKYHPDVSFFSRDAGAQAVAAVPAEALWAQVAAIGGPSGWYYMTWLWRLRGFLDRIVGGIGMRRGRRHSTELRVGDALDFWRVVAVEPGERLTLLAEMKLPGSAVLELQVKSEGEHRSRLITTAHFNPAGLWGLLYWYAIKPIHGRLFRGMTRAIVRRAEAAQARSESIRRSALALLDLDPDDDVSPRPAV